MSWRRSCRREGNCNWRRLSSTPPSRGQKRGLAVGPTKRGKGTKVIALADDHSLPLAGSIESASPHESQLVEGVLGHSFLGTLPARLIGDKAYDSDRLDRNLAERYGIELIAPHRGERREPTQDGRPLRRYRRRWRVERFFAWLHHFRRLVIRWEYHVEEAVPQDPFHELAFMRRSALDTNGERKTVIIGERDDLRPLANLSFSTESIVSRSVG